MPFLYEIISEKELERISTLSSNRDGLLVVSMRVPLPTPPTRGGAEHSNTPTLQHSQGLTLILDGINDPGNLGTIIRIADWYGISQIICSTDTVDCYNPKVLMATMGSFTRVYVEYRDLKEFFTSITPFIKGDNGDFVSENLEQKSSALSGTSFAKEASIPKIY
jgi:tRNA G18 (ribose-2'-O)-methylase SpoU